MNSLTERAQKWQCIVVAGVVDIGGLASRMAPACAVVVTHDSDIAEAMRLVRQHHGKRNGLVVAPGPVGNPSTGEIRGGVSLAGVDPHRNERPHD